MKNVKILCILCLMVISQSCKTKYPIVPIKTSFGKVSTYAGTCEDAQGFCAGLSTDDRNGIIFKSKKGLEMKLSKNDVPDSFVNELINTESFLVDKDFYFSKRLTNKLFEEKKDKNLKLKIKKGEYPVKVKKDNNTIIIIIHLEIIFYEAGELMETMVLDIIICVDC